MKKPLISHQDARNLLKRGSPLYVYRKSVISERYRLLDRAITYGKKRIFYACKANTNMEILKHLRNLGASVECVSRGEVERALKAGFSPRRISYTCSNISKEELAWIMQKRIVVHLDSLTQLRWWGEIRPGSAVSLRINRGFGAGAHRHITTGGPESKFGIYHTHLAEAKKMAKRYRLTIVGLEQHIGSSILKPDAFVRAMHLLFASARQFPDLQFIDFGGGFGIPYRAEQKALKVSVLGKKMVDVFSDFCEEYGRALELWIEPGRFLVAEAGALIARVTDVKKTPGHLFVGVDSGMGHLLRPALYGAHHEIFNLSRPRARKVRADIVGNICESGDVFARKRLIPMPKIGDILLFADAGAYGYTMSSEYNLRKKPKELVLP